MKKYFIKGRAITEAHALELFQKIVGRTATDAERKELSEAWRKRYPAHDPRPGPTKEK